MPLQPGDITDVKITQTANTGENGQILRLKTISYRVRNQGPFSISVPAAEFSVEAVETLLKREAEQIVAILEIT